MKLIVMDLLLFGEEIGNLGVLDEFVVIDLFFEGNCEEIFRDSFVDSLKGALISWFELIYIGQDDRFEIFVFLNVIGEKEKIRFIDLIALRPKKFYSSL